MSIAATAEKTGLFIASYHIGKDAPGAPLFQVNLAVNTVQKVVTGHGRITQVVSPPPVDVRTQLNGTFTYLSTMKDTHILVVATGTPEINWPVHGGIGPVLMPNAQLRMVLDSDWKSGAASYKFQDSQGNWHEVENVPVKLVNNL